VGTPTAYLLTVKLLVNSIISTPTNAKIMTIDIKDFYLNTPMARYEYMQLCLAVMPEDVIEHLKRAAALLTAIRDSQLSQG
jgi:hypothetical protein